MAKWFAPWTWFSSGESHSDNFIRNLTEGTPSHGLPVVTEETALRLSPVMCAVRVISEGIAQLPVKVFRDVQENGRTVRRLASDAPVYQVLHRRPNAWMTSFEWRELMTMHAALMGSGYSIINRVNGRVDELIPVMPGAVTIEFDGAEVRYRVSAEGKTAVYPREDIFHLRGPSMDGVTALPIVRMAAASIGLAQSLEGAQTTLAGNGGRPSSILSNEGEGDLTPERRASVAEIWRRTFGPGGPGGTAVLDKGWKFTPMTMSSVDMQHIESRKMQIEEIARVFRVQPIMLMQADKAATYASAEQMFIAHVIHTLGPWIERWEHAMDRDLLDGGEQLYSHLEVKGLMRGSSKDRAEFYARALGTSGAQGWMTPNEIRALEEMDPAIDGDTLSRPPKETGESDGNEVPRDE